jgi:hypothetical protein
VYGFHGDDDVRRLELFNCDGAGDAVADVAVGTDAAFDELAIRVDALASRLTAA